MEETISIQDIFSVLKKKLLLIITCVFLGVGFSAIITFFFINPMYSSVVQMIVQTPTNENSNPQLSDLNANILMINTYKDVIKSNTILGIVKDELNTQENVKVTEGALKGMISVEQSQNSQMFEIKVTSESPRISMLVANTAAEVFKEQAINFVQVDKVSILSPAIENKNPISPNKKLNILIGLVLGLMVGVGLAFLSEFMNNTIKDSSTIAEMSDLPILGTITELTPKEIEEAENVRLMLPSKNKRNKN